MKVKTTMKAIKESTSPMNLYRAGYCDLQDILTGVEPIAYTCGVYGWNCDIYETHGVTITTGYRGMTGKPINPELIRKYSKKIQAIKNDYSVKYEDRMKKVARLRDKFFEELKGV
jgi:hypothetical protein